MAIWLLLLAVLIAAPANAELRNVLLIISDDQGLDLGVYGNELVRTNVRSRARHPQPAPAFQSPAFGH
ncbi:MAG: hypothetical protein ACT4O5_17245 [Gammaproteobacteria bacterium]